MLNLVLSITLLSLFWSDTDTIWVLSFCACYRSLKYFYHLTCKIDHIVTVFSESKFDMTGGGGGGGKI